MAERYIHPDNVNPEQERVVEQETIAWILFTAHNKAEGLINYGNAWCADLYEEDSPHIAAQVWVLKDSLSGSRSERAKVAEIVCPSYGHDNGIHCMGVTVDRKVIRKFTAYEGPTGMELWEFAYQEEEQSPWSSIIQGYPNDLLQQREAAIKELGINGVSEQDGKLLEALLKRLTPEPLHVVTPKAQPGRMSH